MVNLLNLCPGGCPRPRMHSVGMDDVVLGEQNGGVDDAGSISCLARDRLFVGLSCKKLLLSNLMQRAYPQCPTALTS